jgi:nucleoside-specific outer membrane channel protein Tsx
MYLSRYLPAVAAMCLGVFAAAKANAGNFPSIEYQDFYLSYRYVPNNVQPGDDDGHSIPANEVNLSYVNGWTYGANFFSLDFEQFSKGDPSISISNEPDLGSSEFYGVFRTTFSGDKIFGGNKFAFGPVADVGLRLGGDYDVQNDSFGSYKRLLVAGPQFNFALPKGFWNIAVEVSHEWDTNGFAENGPSTSFAPTYEFETAWLYPFNIGPVPLQFTGFANWIGPKGRGYSGDFYHKTEILLHPKVLVDVGSLVGYTPGKLMAGVGYEYWFNKFGSTKPPLPGTQEHTVFFEVGYNFD